MVAHYRALHVSAASSVRANLLSSVDRKPIFPPLCLNIHPRGHYLRCRAEPEKPDAPEGAIRDVDIV